MLADFIQSIGFVVTFVIDAEEPIRMPAACEPLVACCEALPEGYKQTQCYDWLDGATGNFTVDGCPVLMPSFKESFECAEPSDEAGAAGAGGAGDEPARYRCCYESCGYTHAI
jgi:hypothetical protein